MSSANMGKPFSSDGDTPSPHSSEKLSETSPPAVPPSWAGISNNVINALTKRSLITPAAIAIAPNASPPRVISGSPNEPRNCFPSPTAMWFSRFRKHSHRWRYRTHSWCMHCCFVRYLRPCWRSPPIHDASEPRSVSLRCYIAGAKTCSTTPIFTVWSPQEDWRPTGRAGSTAAASSSCRSKY